MNILKSKVKQKNSQYFNIADLYCNLAEMNKDVLETGILNNPIVVYRIVYENYSTTDYVAKADRVYTWPEDADNIIRYGPTRAISYKPECVGKTYLVHKGNSRVPAALKLGYTHIEGIIDEETVYVL